MGFFVIEAPKIQWENNRQQLPIKRKKQPPFTELLLYARHMLDKSSTGSGYRMEVSTTVPSHRPPQAYRAWGETKGLGGSNLKRELSFLISIESVIT